MPNVPQYACERCHMVFASALIQQGRRRLCSVCADLVQMREPRTREISQPPHTPAQLMAHVNEAEAQFQAQIEEVRRAEAQEAAAVQDLARRNDLAQSIFGDPTVLPTARSEARVHTNNATARTGVALYLGNNYRTRLGLAARVTGGAEPPNGLLRVRHGDQDGSQTLNHHYNGRVPGMSETAQDIVMADGQPYANYPSISLQPGRSYRTRAGHVARVRNIMLPSGYFMVEHQIGHGTWAFEHFASGEFTGSTMPVTHPLSLVAEIAAPVLGQGQQHGLPIVAPAEQLAVPIEQRYAQVQAEQRNRDAALARRQAAPDFSRVREDGEPNLAEQLVAPVPDTADQTSFLTDEDAFITGLRKPIFSDGTPRHVTIHVDEIRQHFAQRLESLLESAAEARGARDEFFKGHISGLALAFLRVHVLTPDEYDECLEWTGNRLAENTAPPKDLELPLLPPL